MIRIFSARLEMAISYQCLLDLEDGQATGSSATTSDGTSSHLGLFSSIFVFNIIFVPDINWKFLTTVCWIGRTGKQW